MGNLYTIIKCMTVIYMKQNKPNKLELKELKDKYKNYCRIRYYIILFLYFWEELSKNYAYLAPLLLVFGILSKTAVIIATPIAITGSLVAFIAKWYQLKNMKFRKKGFFNGDK